VVHEHAKSHGAQVSHVFRSALKGYSATIPDNRVAEVRRDPKVAFVSEDRPVHALAQTLPTGIDRIDAEASSRFSGVTSPACRGDRHRGQVPHSDLNVVGGKTALLTGMSYTDGKRSRHARGRHRLGARKQHVGRRRRRPRRTDLLGAGPEQQRIGLLDLGRPAASTGSPRRPQAGVNIKVAA
jgi:hypothetical protein